ncbi:MAG: hypothetical protein OEM48_07050 [Gammaproteobacteria bacterium]|nr:hypothetical protein [Gammaproteobacteria bacterium]MDH3369768.1 hypothetical protein [Gammaproteobacteria bacterium]MDH3406672.1 hypothetical protein [Gammaproteobacteria bacterium]MDH3563227.1 hypothetical protein [Gammaproteobacteria bacterium]MDH5486008.1 hypothetical protein [Gammaproteobacteria bacterium]
MTDPVLALLMIVVLFILLLIVKKITEWKFCVMCTSVSLTWMTLLVLYWLGMFGQPVIIAVLMGQTVVGMYYFLEHKTEGSLHIFRLPLLLTLTLAAFVLLDVTMKLAYSLGLLALLWILLLLMYFYRHNPKTKIVVDRIIACCRDW